MLNHHKCTMKWPDVFQMRQHWWCILILWAHNHVWISLKAEWTFRFILLPLYYTVVGLFIFVRHDNDRNLLYFFTIVLFLNLSLFIILYHNIKRICMSIFIEVCVYMYIFILTQRLHCVHILPHILTSWYWKWK